MYDFLKVAQHQTDAENAEISAPKSFSSPFAKLSITLHDFKCTKKCVHLELGGL